MRTVPRAGNTERRTELNSRGLRNYNMGKKRLLLMRLINISPTTDDSEIAAHWIVVLPPTSVIMKVLLTGGSGFIAAHCLDMLLERGYVYTNL